MKLITEELTDVQLIAEADEKGNGYAFVENTELSDLEEHDLVDINVKSLFEQIEKEKLVKMNKNFLITTGGSGGHVVPATILYDHLSEDTNIILTTDKRGLKYFDNSFYEFFTQTKDLRSQDSKIKSTKKASLK